MKITLFQPDIAQNLGAAMRLCACFGVPLAIIEPCGFPLTAKALRRTAMDYGATVDLIRHKTWSDFADNESQHGNRIVLLSTKAAVPITKFKFRPNDTLLFGRESSGVPGYVHEHADEKIIIPLNGDARSFNLVTSASIALFEALRQTGGLE
ncbi:MAG: rRNA methyltransferase [Robiginitomaculum sp.]|nr:MAG: rRNA methyltransferase [Robiginitomaculum sp.]